MLHVSLVHYFNSLFYYYLGGRAVLGLHCCAWTFSSYSELGHSWQWYTGFLLRSPLIAEDGLQALRLRNFTMLAQLPQSIWNSSQSRVELMSSALGVQADSQLLDQQGSPLIHYFKLLSNISLNGCITKYLSIYFLMDTWAISSLRPIKVRIL